MTSTTNDLLQCTLSVAVPIEIAHLRLQGGPYTYQVEAAQEHIEQQHLGEAILYRVPGETSKQMTILCGVLAIMAFQPGGVKAFGLHFQACKCVSKSQRTCSDERLLYGICACQWCHRPESEDKR